VFGLWIQAEVIAMATDLAEFVGASIGIHLLFPAIPLFIAGIMTAIAAFGILSLQARGFRGPVLFLRPVGRWDASALVFLCVVSAFSATLR